MQFIQWIKLGQIEKENNNNKHWIVHCAHSAFATRVCKKLKGKFVCSSALLFIARICSPSTSWSGETDFYCYARFLLHFPYFGNLVQCVFFFTSPRCVFFVCLLCFISPSSSCSLLSFSSGFVSVNVCYCPFFSTSAFFFFLHVFHGIELIWQNQINRASKQNIA